MFHNYFKISKEKTKWIKIWPIRYKIWKRQRPQIKTSLRAKWKIIKTKIINMGHIAPMTQIKINIVTWRDKDWAELILRWTTIRKFKLEERLRIVVVSRDWIHLILSRPTLFRKDNQPRTKPKNNIKCCTQMKNREIINSHISTWATISMIKSKCRIILILAKEFWIVMVNLWKLSNLCKLKSRGQNNRQINPQESIFQEPAWTTIIKILSVQIRLKSKARNKIIRCDTVKILDLKIRMFWVIWIIEYNSQRIYWLQAMDKRQWPWWTVDRILPYLIKERAKVQGANHTTKFINNNNQTKAPFEETTTKIIFPATRCKITNLFKIQGRLLNSKWDNRDMLLRTK